MNNYEDIINLPYRKSCKRVHMSSHARAAQFAPFAALTGYDSLVNEAARYTDKKILIDEDVKVAIDMQLQAIRENINESPDVTITYFVPDEQKSGGVYLTITGTAKKIDDFKQTISVDDKVIAFADILSLTTSSFSF